MVTYNPRTATHSDAIRHDLKGLTYVAFNGSFTAEGSTKPPVTYHLTLGLAEGWTPRDETENQLDLEIGLRRGRPGVYHVDAVSTRTGELLASSGRTILGR